MKKTMCICMALILMIILLLPSCGGGGEITTVSQQSETSVVTTSDADVYVTSGPLSEPLTRDDSPAAEYRFDCESACFEPGESFTVVLSVNCTQFCSGCCYISFDSSILTCTRLSLAEIDGVKGICDSDSLKSGLAVVSLYSARPVDLSYSRAAMLEFTVNENVREDTDSEIVFSDGTLFIAAHNATVT